MPQLRALIQTENPARIDEPNAGPLLRRDHKRKRRRLELGICVAIVAVASWPVFRRYKAAEPIRSLAVLPLENLSGDPTQEYFADGMSEELITMLARDSTLRIISRTSVMQYKGVRRPLPEIARALGVDGRATLSDTKATFFGYLPKFFLSSELHILMICYSESRPLRHIEFLYFLYIKFPNIPFLLITARHDVSIATTALRNGAFGYLFKPFDREQLSFPVRQALEYRRLKLENLSLREQLSEMKQQAGKQHGQRDPLLRRRATGNLSQSDPWPSLPRLSAIACWRAHPARRIPAVERGQPRNTGIVLSSFLLMGRDTVARTHVSPPPPSLFCRDCLWQPHTRYYALNGGSEFLTCFSRLRPP